jgi:sensor histidine kinase regulating citrate/malate metabolism
MEVLDDGKGYNGSAEQLGSELLKTKSQTSNGIGLFLTRDLVKRMKGRIRFLAPPSGFLVELTLPAAERTNG